MDEIQVLEISTGETVTILRSTYDADPSLYTIKEEAAAEPATATFDEAALIAQVTRASSEAATAAVNKAMKAAGAGTVDRSRLAAGGDTVTVAAGEGGRATPRWEHQYRGLPADERELRTPENDLMIQDWCRAKMNRDVTELRRIAAMELNTSDHATLDRAAMGTGAGIGGEFVPVPLSDTLVQKRNKRERIAPNSQRITSEATSMRIPTENVLVVVDQVVEGQAIPSNDPTFAEVLLTKQKTADIVETSWELTQDASAAFSLVNIITNQGARVIAVQMDTQSAADGDRSTAGSGANHYDALELSTSISEITTGTVMGLDAVQKVFYGLPSEYRESGTAVWMGNAAVIQRMGLLLDGDNRPMFQGMGQAPMGLSDVDNAVGQIMGKPLLEVPFATEILMFGSLLDGFTVLMDGGIRVDTSTESGTAFDNDLVRWRIAERRDSGVTLGAAFRKSEAFLT